MDASRLGRGEMIAAVSALVLFIVMFFDWFGGDFYGIGFNAWQSFDFIDLILFLTIVVDGRRGRSHRHRAERQHAGCDQRDHDRPRDLLRSADPVPDPRSARPTWTREIGVFLGLIASAGIAYGGWMAMQEEGTSFQDHTTGPRVAAARIRLRLRRRLRRLQPPSQPPPPAGSSPTVNEIGPPATPPPAPQPGPAPGWYPDPSGAGIRCVIGTARTGPTTARPPGADFRRLRRRMAWRSLRWSWASSGSTGSARCWRSSSATSR